MKKLLPLFIGLVSLQLSAQEIPNADFENWNFDNTWTWNPDGWETQNGQLVEHVTRDSTAYEGDYAMRVTYSDQLFGAFGEAYTTIPLTSIAPSLDFYVKAEVEAAAVIVVITYFNEGNSFYSNYWTTNESVEQWTFASIPLEQLEPVMTHAELRVQFLGGDLVPSSGWISVDAMEFSQTQTISEQAEQPTMWFDSNDSSLRCRASSSYNVQLFDGSGRLVEVFQIEGNYSLAHLPSGLYIATSGEGEERKSVKLICP